MSLLQQKLQEIIRLESGVTCLTLTDFRNYKNLRLETRIAPIIITGENGSGKTNILEALSFLTPGRGLRSAKLSEIKRIHQIDDINLLAADSWSVAAEIKKAGELHTIGTAVQKGSSESADEIHSF